MDENRQYIVVDDEKDESLDIVGIVDSLWKHKIMIAALALVVAITSFVYTVFFTDHTYTSAGVVYLSNKSEVPTQQTAVSANDIVISRALGETYKEILTTRSFYFEVSEDLNGMFTPGQVANMMSVEIINETELIRIRTTSVSPDVAYKVAKSIFNRAQARLSRIYPNGRVEVIDEPYLPTTPNAKGTVKKTMLGFMIGAVIGIICVFVRKMFDIKVRNAADIVRRYGVSVLGELAGPKTTGKKKKDKKDGSSTHSDYDVILNENSRFDTVETYKFIRTNIMFSIPKSDKGKVLVVTSAVPGDGKTTTSINLAITFAQTGAKVIIVDCDLRKARVHSYLGLKHSNGISNVLCGFADVESAVVKDVRENLDVLTVGNIPPNPAELLDSEEFGKVLTELQEKYDYILIDTPPMTVVADASIVMQGAHGVVVVARKNQTTFDMLDETIEGIKKSSAKPLGVVVLDSEQKEKKYGYYQRNKYSYKYRYDYAYSEIFENKGKK